MISILKLNLKFMIFISWRILCVQSFLFIFLVQLAHAKINIQQVKNNSNLKVVKVKKEAVEYCGLNKKVDKCKGSISSNASLEKIGWTKEELKTGVYCITGDFDNNGSMDFVLWGLRHSRGGGETRDNLVLLFDGPRIIFKKIIKNQLPLCLYTPTARRGPYGEPKTKVPGLIRQGEGDVTDVFLWDKKKKDFVNTQYESGE